MSSDTAKGSKEKKEEKQEEYYDRKLFSDFTLHNIREGFFKDYLDQIDFQMTKEFIEGFSHLKTDEDRLTHIWSFKAIHNVRIRRSFKQKNKEMSELRRSDGNKAFQKNNNDEALMLYSQAVILAPHEEGECLSLSYANRSAVLHHQENHLLCLKDIQLAIEAGYPPRLMYKVLDRKGQCLMRLDQYSEAEKAFSDALEALSASELESKKLNSWKKDLAKKIQQCNGQTDAPCDIRALPSGASVYRGVNPALPGASSTVTIHQSQLQGRYAVAKESVPAGEVVMAEKPYATVMKADKTSKHCYNCFNSLVAGVGCHLCSGVSFCSVGCRDLALATHHKWECQFLSFLSESGISLNCYLALRIITQHGLGFFQKIQSRFGEPLGLPSEEFPHRPNDYLSIYHLEGLEKERPQNNFIPLTIMATFLLKVLQRSNYFGNWQEKASSGSQDDDLTKEEAFIGGLLLRNLQVVQFNAHEVSGIEFRNEACLLLKSKSTFLGIGIYPTASLCNHACYPSVARYFEGTKIVLVSIRPLQPGDVIAENYGPIFSRNNLQERQKKLQLKYWFKCNCEACLGDWPTYDKMTSSRVLRCQKCNSALPSKGSKESHVKCLDCGTSHNVINALNKLEEADKFYEEGKKHLEGGRREEAIHSFINYVDSVYSLVLLPMYELFVVFDSLRTMFAARSTIRIINVTRS